MGTHPGDRRSDGAGRREFDEGAAWLHDTLVRMESKLDDNTELITDLRIKQGEFLTRGDFGRFIESDFVPLRDQANRLSTQLKTLSAAFLVVFSGMGTVIYVIHQVHG